MRFWILGAVLAVVGLGASAGCGEESTPLTCDEGGCECRNVTSCNLDCQDVVGCEPSCLNFDSFCNATCADDCNFDCRGGDRVDGVCGGSCGTSCNASCGSVATCIVDTGPTSAFTCVNATNCQAELGDGSIANCLNVSGTCAITCLGQCEVFCELTEVCNVLCPEGQERRICGPGFIICGPECPPSM